MSLIDVLLATCPIYPRQTHANQINLALNSDTAFATRGRNTPAAYVARGKKEGESVVKVEYLPVASSGAIFLLSRRSANDVKLSRSLVIDLHGLHISLKI